ncbi:Uncharacterised protein [Vibrio cholerae]|nr:Uncharacterised protein [Vibrio cholerae]
MVPPPIAVTLARTMTPNGSIFKRPASIQSGLTIYTTMKNIEQANWGGFYEI